MTALEELKTISNRRFHLILNKDEINKNNTSNEISQELIKLGDQYFTLGIDCEFLYRKAYRIQKNNLDKIYNDLTLVLEKLSNMYLSYGRINKAIQIDCMIVKIE